MSGQGLAAVLLRPGPQVLGFQAALLAAITPFTESGGTAAAFVADPGEDISQSTLDWSETAEPPAGSSGAGPPRADRAAPRAATDPKRSAHR
ncbi:hypothetical protein ACFWWA_27920 [Streptomyces goshikiensis]|uniref:hypothetical protein n=1 Tax=Streptomyces goshikiensis TaxID=1942 RepID=UPI003667A099